MIFVQQLMLPHSGFRQHLEGSGWRPALKMQCTVKMPPLSYTRVKLWPAQGKRHNCPGELKVAFRAFWRPAGGIFCTCTSAARKRCVRCRAPAPGAPVHSRWLGVGKPGLARCAETSGDRARCLLQAGHQPAKSYWSAKWTVSCPWGQCKHHFASPQ